MGKVVVDISMSLDGFITAANRSPEEPLGEGGEERLHAWGLGDEDERNRKVHEDYVASLGAIISGRRNYDDSLPWWGADGPHAPLPVFVVTHDVPSESPENGVYMFVTGGIERALELAKAAAGDKDIHVMGGASIIQQYLAAGLVDEISIHLVPVLFGNGIRLFEHLGGEHILLEIAETIETPAAVHLRFRVVK